MDIENKKYRQKGANNNHNNLLAFVHVFVTFVNDNSQNPHASVFFFLFIKEHAHARILKEFSTRRQNNS